MSRPLSKLLRLWGQQQLARLLADAGLRPVPTSGG